MSFLWVASFMLGKKTLLHVRISNLKPDLKILKEIVILGSAPFFMNASEGIMTICFNTQVQRFGGDTAVSAMTILFSVFQFMLLPVEGVAQGSQPIIGYNYGAGEYGRVKVIIYSFLFITLSVKWLKFNREGFYMERYSMSENSFLPSACPRKYNHYIRNKLF